MNYLTSTIPLFTNPLFKLNYRSNDPPQSILRQTNGYLQSSISIHVRMKWSRYRTSNSNLQKYPKINSLHFHSGYFAAAPKKYIFVAPIRESTLRQTFVERPNQPIICANAFSAESSHENGTIAYHRLLIILLYSYLFSQSGSQRIPPTLTQVFFPRIRQLRKFPNLFTIWWVQLSSKLSIMLTK